jgi:glycosyltransferase involved in cell wall biosynthesis
LEAMATGLFPVVSRIKANEPWIEDGRTGLLFEPGSGERLAEALGRALDSPELRQGASAVNRPRVERDAGMKSNMDRLAGHFERLIAGRRRVGSPAGTTGISVGR